MNEQQQTDPQKESPLKELKRKFFIDRAIQLTIAVCSLVGTACLMGAFGFATKVYRSWDSMQNRMTNMENSINAVQNISNNTASDVKVIKAEQANQKDETKEIKQYLQAQLLKQ
jgi:hypothetical protein